MLDLPSRHRSPCPSLGHHGARHFHLMDFSPPVKWPILSQNPLRVPGSSIAGLQTTPKFCCLYVYFAYEFAIRGGLGEDRWSQLCCVLAGRLGSCESLHHVIRRLTPCLAGDGGVPWDLGGSCSWISVWLLDFPTRWSLRSKGEFVNKLSRTIPYAASTVLGIIS